MKTKNYSPILLGETKDLSNDEWLKWRQHGPYYADASNPAYIPVCIGGSDASVIFGDNPWKSSLELFHEKSGIKTPKYARKMNQDILDAGHQLEDFVAKNFKKYMLETVGIPDTAIEIWNDTNMYQHPYYRFAVCNLDRRIKVNGIEGILEIKTTGSFQDIENCWKKGIVPKKYEWQCRYYMATMNLPYTYIACMWGFTTKEMAVIRVERDLEIEKVMMETIEEFVECCEMGVEPEMQSGHLTTLANYYVRLYGEIDTKAPAIEFPDNDDTRDLIDEALAIEKEKELLDAKEKELTEREAKVVTQIMAFMNGQGTYGTLRLDENTVAALKVKIPMKKATFDEEGFKKAYPKEYAEFLEPVFNVTSCKKKYKKEASKYVVPGVVATDKPATLAKVELKDIPLVANI